ncbi:MAG TPA: acyltransferase family protein [Flavisolibacter sp.]|nr:acyltransferase family protein [Flavisolibacter sp.]
MPSSNRYAYLDWLRIMAIIGVLFFHSAMPYVAEWGWHIKNKETSNLLMEFNFFLSRFRMPLLFFISGAITHVMLRSRTTGQFIALRFRRLLVPLLFGMLLIVPIQVYMERLHTGYKGNFLEFYPSVFTTGPYPKGNLSYHHLWFIAYLFVYDLIFAPIFRWLMRLPASRFSWWTKGLRVYLITVPSILLYTVLVLRFPETNDITNDWCYFIYWLGYLLAGFFALLVPGLMDVLAKYRRTSLTIALLVLLVLNYMRWNQKEPYDFFTDYSAHWQTYAYLLLYPLVGWFWVFTAVGYGKTYLDHKKPVLGYLNNAVYPFYILHQTVIVVLTYYLVRTSDTIGMKYLFTVLSTFFITMAIYHVVIRPNPVMRFLFGMKKAALKKEKKVTPETATIPVVPA